MLSEYPLNVPSMLPQCSLNTNTQSHLFYRFLAHLQLIIMMEALCD
jgi:hypothetical protein